MHSLKGGFAHVDQNLVDDKGKTYYVLKLIFPPTRSRTMYFPNAEVRDDWVNYFKEILGNEEIGEHYTFIDKIGQGQFGTVYKATHNETGRKVAVKTLCKKKMNSYELEVQRREIDVLKICQHPNVIRLLDVYEDIENIYMVIEYLEGGDLYHYLKNR